VTNDCRKSASIKDYGQKTVEVGLVLAHPHFRKVIKVTLPGGPEATITYDTLPVNEDHTTKAAAGEFLIPGHNPRISFSAEVKAGSVTIPAGEYFIGALKNSDKDWTMGLYPGPLARGAKPDLAKVIKLESIFLTSEGKAEHMLIDLQPGTGKLQNKAMLTIHFGSLFLGGALS
jgi:hypothetical protein